jgi:uncharacterized protein (TIGR02246 family)
MTAPPGPQTLLDRFAECWNAGDAESLAALFSPDADFVNVVGLWWRRREDIRNAHAYGFERIFGGSTMRWLRSRVRPLGDVAVVHGLWELQGQRGPAGEAGAPRRGVLVVVARRTGLGWEAVAAQNTDRVPGADTWLAGEGGARPVGYRRTPSGEGA